MIAGYVNAVTIKGVPMVELVHGDAEGDRHSLVLSVEGAREVASALLLAAAAAVAGAERERERAN